MDANARERSRSAFAHMLVHMTLTTVVAAATYSLIRWLWCPGYFWQLAAGHSLFLLVCAVDAVLGPLLTFLVLNLQRDAEAEGDLLAIVLAASA